MIGEKLPYRLKQPESSYKVPSNLGTPSATQSHGVIKGHAGNASCIRNGFLMRATFDWLDSAYQIRIRHWGVNVWTLRLLTSIRINPRPSDDEALDSVHDACQSLHVCMDVRV